MHTDIMIDFETLAVCPNAVALSLGLVAFDRESGAQSTASLFIAFDQEEQSEMHRAVDPSTLAWWDQQDPVVRAKAFDEGPRVSLETGLHRAASFIYQMADPENVWVWGNGSDFDNALFVDLCEQVNLPLPWKFYNNRCFRTLKNTLGAGVPLLEEFGKAHDPVDDAMKQALNVQRIFNAR